MPKNRLFSTFFNFFQLSSTFIKTQKVPQKKQFWQKSKAIGLPFLPKIAHFQLSPTFFNFHQDSKSASKEATLAKEQGYRLAIFALLFCQNCRLAIFAKNRLFSTFFNFFQLSSTFIKTQKVAQKKQFWQKSKAIGLPFLPKIAHFQLSPTSSTFIKTQKVPQKKQFWQKSKAIGLPFFAKKSPIFNSRQLSSTFIKTQKVPQEKQL